MPQIFLPGRVGPESVPVGIHCRKHGQSMVPHRCQGTSLRRCRFAGEAVAILINYTQLAVRPLTNLGPFYDDFVDGASEPLKTLLALDLERALAKRVKTHAQQT